MQPLVIDKKNIGPGNPAFVVAELSGNHHQRYEEAERLIHAAAEAGADAVKLQTLSPDGITLDCDNDYFRISEGTIWEGRNLYDLYSEVQTPWEWQPKLKKLANSLDLILFSSPFDHDAVDFLEQELDVPCYKIASFELVDIPLIERVARTGKPIIMSTGMATEEEVERAMSAARDAGAGPLALLKCTSAYPAPPEEMNLKAIPWMQERFDVPIGLSDHSLGMTTSLTACALGACIIEKHLILDRKEGGPDASFSLEAHEFAELVLNIREAESALGEPVLRAGKHESASIQFRRSLFVVEDVKKGDLLDETNVRSIRPGNGLAPMYLKQILGNRAMRNIEKGTPLAWEHIEGGKP